MDTQENTDAPDAAPPADGEAPARTPPKRTRNKPAPPAEDETADNSGQVKPRTFVCTEETFWKNRLWRVGERTGDPRAEGNCFREE